MKKTVTTILSLALALILVSSLSSGVILAKGPSDNASDRGKERARHHTERDVGILSCVSAPGEPPFFEAFDDSTDQIELPGEIAPPMMSPCSVNIAVLLNDENFRMADVGTVFAASVIFYSYTFVRVVRTNDE